MDFNVYDDINGPRSLDTFDDDEYSSNVPDDPLMVDFHLGNAINLDLVRYFVSGERPDYNLYIPKYLSTSWMMLEKYIGARSRIVGFLKITSKLFLGHLGGWEPMTPSIWKSLLDVTVKGLVSKGIEIPICDHAASFQTKEVRVPSVYIKTFNMILAAISTLSEKLRGGKHSPYAVAEMLDEYVSVFLGPPLGLELLVGRNFSAIIDRTTGSVYCGNYDSVLLLMDTIGQRICAIIGNQLTSVVPVPGTIDIDFLISLFSIGDKILLYSGNEGYEVIAMFESLVVATILENNPDKISEGTDFFDNCVEEVSEICKTMDNGSFIIKLVGDLIESIRYLDTNVLSNVFCLYRIWGHPAVDIKAGMQKVYDKAMATKLGLAQSEGLALCQFRHMFLLNYISRHKSYPPLSIQGEGYVQDCLRGGFPIDQKHGGFSILSYLDIEIEQIWGVPSTYDVCHILNDKAVSPNRAELLNSVSSGRGTIFGTMRRGIIRWMEGDSIRCKEFLDDIDANGLPDDDLIIGMYEKEREIKVKARMFSLMSEKMRMYIVLTEELIANHILPYFPEITMKDPLNVQIRKIWSVGGIGQYPYNPNINIDFEKWNLNMRPEFTNGLFAQMDKMFGYSNLIKRTHQIFSESFIYSCSGKYLPKIVSNGFSVDPPMAYIGHKGGFEGLRQKGWTVATVCLLAYTAHQMKIDMKLLGQGDNQVIKLYMPVKKWENLCYTEEAKIQESRDLTKTYITRMRENFEDAGLPIKVRETWVSARLFMYGKAMYLDGFCLPQWVKKLLRSYALSNEGTVTISGVIGTIASNMTAAAGVSEMPDIMYVLFLFLGEWSLEYLLHYHPFTRQSIRQGEQYNFRLPDEKKQRRTPPVNMFQLVASILMVPTAVGGSVTIPLTGFIFRGFPDHASEGYAWLNMLRHVKSPLKIIFSNWYSFLKNHTIQADMLIQSPWSLNHLKPPTPGIQSRDMIRDWLLSGRFPRNKFLRNMKIINESFPRKLICDELLSDPINPLITYEVLNSFPQSYYDSILRRFEGTRSVRKLAMRESYTVPIVRRLMKVEENHIFYLIWRPSVAGEIMSECATEHTRLSRVVGWEREIIGLTTPHPLEFSMQKVCFGYDPSCDGTDYILVRYDEDGEYPPYLGSRVRTKVVSLQDEGAKHEPLICANARLARYMKWLNIGENLLSVVIKCTNSICDTDIFNNFYDSNPGEEGYTGCVEHRFNPAAASDGCFINYAPQLGRKVYMSGDYMPMYGKGKDNYTIHFQALYCFLQYISARSRRHTTSHHHLICEKCIVKCNDKIGDIQSEHPSIDLAFGPNILPILRETIGFIDQLPTIGVNVNSFLQLGNDLQYSPELNLTKCYYGAIYTLASKCVLTIITKGSGESVGVGTEDLQSFPRVYAYKLYTEHIMSAIRNILLYVFILRNNLQLNGLGFVRAKSSLLRLLDRTPLDKFKELGSLCVGRNSKTEDLGMMVPTGSFPDDVQSFLKGVKNTLIETIGSNTGFDTNIPSSIYVCKLSITEREYRTILGTLCMVNMSCVDCCQSLKDNIPIHEIKCREGHIPKLLNKVRLVTTSLDKIFKMLSIKKTIRKEKTFQWTMTSVKTLPEYNAPEIENFFSSTGPLIVSLKAMRKVSLPTASIYKWNSVFGAIDSLSYDVVIILGDGVGGTSMIASRRMKKAKIFPLAKFERHRMIPQDSTSIHPFLSRGHSNISYSLLESIDDDITTDIWTSDMQDALQKISGDILIVSDIEGVDQHVIISKIIQVCKPKNVDWLIKFYDNKQDQGYDSWMKLLRQSAIILTKHSNTQYREAFAYSGLYLTCKQSDQSNFSTLDVEQRIIESLYPTAVNLSWSLAGQHLTSLGITVGKNLIVGDPGKLIWSLLCHINARHRFPQDKIRQNDSRNLSDGKLIRLVRAIKLIVLSCTSEEIYMQEWFEQLTLGRGTQKDRREGFMLNKIDFVLTETRFIRLEEKDRLAARIFRSSRRQRVNINSYSRLIELMRISSRSLISADVLELISSSEDVELSSDISFDSALDQLD